MSNILKNPPENYQVLPNSRVDQLISDGSNTKADLDNAIMASTDALNNIESLNEMELTASAHRLLNEIQSSVYQAIIFTSRAKVILQFGKKDK
jgi:DNA-binding MltR family transcriptional regulator